MSAQVDSSGSKSEELSEEELQQIAYDQANKDKSMQTAFFYRKDETDDLIESKLDSVIEKQEKYFNEFSGRAVAFFLSHGKIPNEQTINGFIRDERHIAKQLDLPIHKIIGYMIDGIKNKMASVAEVNEHNINEKIAEIYAENAEELHEGSVAEIKIAAYEEFYGESYDKLGEGGMVYAPPAGKHKWSYNASWLLGHFHKGTDIFIIKSSINENGMLRGKTSDKEGDFGSGFFREIAISYLYGFRVKPISDGRIIMHHPHQGKYRPLQSVKLEDILKFTLEEMKPFYVRAMKQYNRSVEYLARIEAARHEAEMARHSPLGTPMLDSERREQSHSQTSDMKNSVKDIEKPKPPPF